MPDRDVPATYAPLKKFIAARGGLRFAMHGPLRDRMVDLAVEHWPIDCEPPRLKEVLAAKMRIAVRERYGSILATFLISVLVQAIANMIVDWWFSRQSHRVLMHGWASAAKSRDV